MTENIMKDNLMYLETWMDYNPRLRENLTVEGNTLVYQDHASCEKINIGNFYLPEMLYNEEFRLDISSSELSSKDLFQIIKLYVQTQEILEVEQRELQMYPNIIDIKLLKDKQNQEFLMLEDYNHKKYRYDAENIEQVINHYNELKEKNGSVSLKELGSVILNGN